MVSTGLHHLEMIVKVRGLSNALVTGILTLSLITLRTFILRTGSLVFERPSIATPVKQAYRDKVMSSQNLWGIHDSDSDISPTHIYVAYVQRQVVHGLVPVILRLTLVEAY